jgi:hypothetical protein
MSSYYKIIINALKYINTLLTHVAHSQSTL